jgi:hypothetical protein
MAPAKERHWPSPPGEPAYHGLAGEITRVIEPHSEADPIAILEQTTASWEFYFGLLERFVEREGHANVPQDHREGEHKLGAWVSWQRHVHRSGDLDSDFRRVVAQIEKVPGPEDSELDVYRITDSLKDLQSTFGGIELASGDLWDGVRGIRLRAAADLGLDKRWGRRWVRSPA